MTGAEAPEQEEGARYLTELVLMQIHAFEAKQQRELTPEERMAFIAGHFRGFVLGRKVGKVAQ